MATANLGAAAFVYKGNWALGGGTGGNGAYKRMHVVRNNHSIWVAIVETEEEPTSTSSEWALMLENADEQAVIALISPSISTGAITNITGTSAVVTVTLQKFGLVAAPSIGVEYRQTGTTTWSRTATQTPAAIGNIGVGVSGLALSTGYEVRAFTTDPKNPDILSVGEALTFSTTSAYIAMPTVSVSGYPDNISTTPTLSTSFSAVGASDTHASTTWRIKNSGGTVVWDSPNNTTNKTSISIPAGQLLPNTAYTFEVMHTGTALGNSAVGALTATTVDNLLVEYSLVAGGKSGGQGGNEFAGKLAPGGNGGEVINSTFKPQVGTPVAVVIGGSDTNSSFGGIVAISGKGALGGGGVGVGAGGTGGTPGKDGPICIDGQVRGSSGGSSGGYGSPGEPGGKGGGNGSTDITVIGSPGTDGTGGGGGGVGARGGTGILVIRYKGTTPRATGGTITTSGGYTYHTFTASGTFTAVG